MNAALTERRVSERRAPVEAPCPHCGEGKLRTTATTAQDTDGKTVTVWECDRCGYSEGRFEDAPPELQEPA